MKKKIIILLSVVIILLMGIVVWFNIPLDLMDLDPNEVMEIVVFNGNSGNATHITDKEQIQHIVENLNGVEVKRSKPSLGYMGYGFKVTIYLSDGNEAGDWNNFIINSDDTIRKDPFFYSVTKGNIDYSYIEGIVEQQNFQLVEQTRAHFCTTFGVMRHARNLALPLGELAAQPTERAKYDHTKGQQPAG